MTILLVEDDEHLRDVIRELLSNKGYRVLEAENAAKAIALFRRDRTGISLLLSDVVLPKTNGVNLYTELKAMAADLQALFMSGYSKDILSDWGEISPEHNFIEKPFTIDELLKKIDQILDGKRKTPDKSI